MRNKKPFIVLKIFNQRRKLIRKVSTRKKKRIYFFLQAGSWKNHTFLLKVIYDSSRGYVNGGEYKTKKDLTHALRVFTEKELVEEFC